MATSKKTETVAIRGAHALLHGDRYAIFAHKPKLPKFPECTLEQMSVFGLLKCGTYDGGLDAFEPFCERLLSRLGFPENVDEELAKIANEVEKNAENERLELEVD